MVEEIVDLEGMAEVLHVSVATVRRKAEEGSIPGMKIGSLWRFSPTRVIERLSEPVDVMTRSAGARNARRVAA